MGSDADRSSHRKVDFSVHVDWNVNITKYYPPTSTSIDRCGYVFTLPAALKIASPFFPLVASHPDHIKAAITGVCIPHQLQVRTNEAHVGYLQEQKVSRNNLIIQEKLAAGRRKLFREER